MTSKNTTKAVDKLAVIRANSSIGDASAGVPISHLMVSAAADLGGGFMLVKVDAGNVANKRRGAGTERTFLESLPTISDAHVDEVFRYRRGRILQGVDRLGKASPVDSAQFMARFGEQEQMRRGEQERAGELLDSEQLAARMGVSIQAISKAVKDKRMFSLGASAGRHLYPAFFANSGIDRKALYRVSQKLDTLPGASKWQFFTTPKISLGSKTPIEALEQGELESVLVAASGFLEA